MGNTKLFAIWLAQAVHKRKMTDVQILALAKNIWKIEDEEWVKEQIKAVNADTDKIYITLSKKE